MIIFYVRISIFKKSEPVDIHMLLLMVQEAHSKPGETSKMELFAINRSSSSQMFFKKGAQKVSQYSQENTCVGVSF